LSAKQSTNTDYLRIRWHRSLHLTASSRSRGSTDAGNIHIELGHFLKILPKGQNRVEVAEPLLKKQRQTQQAAVAGGLGMELPEEEEEEDNEEFLVPPHKRKRAAAAAAAAEGRGVHMSGVQDDENEDGW
jgi:hypothetical protein